MARDADRRRQRRSRSRRRSPSKSRSPSRKANRKNEATSKKEASRKEVKKPIRSAVTEESSADSSAEEPAEESGSVSLEAKVALLEVENASLKAENIALKKKLVELLKRSGGSKDAGKKAAKIGQAPDREPSPPPQPKPAAPVDRRQQRLAEAAAAAAADGPTDRRRQREEPRTTSTEKPEEEAEDPDKQNAVLLANAAMEAYNESVTNNIPPEKRLPLVNEKLERFLGNFHKDIQILDLKSGKPIIKDGKIFTQRYNCVFRESGAKLKGSVNKRFYYDASGSKPTYCLDYETHESLVTATPGTPQDGKLGVRDPRTEHLVMLYEEKGGKITRMWLRPDTEKIGSDPTAIDTTITRTEAFKAFEAKIAELRGGSAGEFFFNNYHDIPTIG